MPPPLSPTAARLLGRIADIYKARFTEMGQTISMDMGAPISFATRFQAGAGMGHFKTAQGILETYKFHEDWGPTAVVREPIGVIGMITPWNWPANQICCKVAGALAAGCTMVLEALRGRATVGVADRRDPRGSRRSQRRLQSRQRRWSRRRRGNGRPSRHRRDLVHGLDRRRHRRRHQGRADRQARRPGTRRQVRQHPARRLRFRRRSQERRDALLPQFRSVL